MTRSPVRRTTRPTPRIALALLALGLVMGAATARAETPREQAAPSTPSQPR